MVSVFGNPQNDRDHGPQPPLERDPIVAGPQPPLEHNPIAAGPPGPGLPIHGLPGAYVAAPHYGLPNMPIGGVVPGISPGMHHSVGMDMGRGMMGSDAVVITCTKQVTHLDGTVTTYQVQQHPFSYQPGHANNVWYQRPQVAINQQPQAATNPQQERHRQQMRELPQRRTLDPRRVILNHLRPEHPLLQQLRRLDVAASILQAAAVEFGCQTDELIQIHVLQAGPGVTPPWKLRPYSEVAFRPEFVPNSYTFRDLVKRFGGNNPRAKLNEVVETRYGWWCRKFVTLTEDDMNQSVKTLGQWSDGGRPGLYVYIG